MVVFKKVARIWNRLVGDVEEFPLMTRIFHSICLICAIALIYNIPLNYFVGLSLVAVIAIVSLLIVTGIYLLSRVKRKTSIAVMFFCFIGLLLFTVNFFLNSGVDGPTDLFLLLIMVVMAAILPVKRYWIAVATNLLILLVLHYIQYQHAAWVPQTYLRPLDRYLDLSSAYVTVVILIVFTFYVIRKNYEVARKSAEEKATAMKVLNEEKNKLLSIISHDLRAPLSNIQNYLELLSEIKLSSDERIEIESQLLKSTSSTLDLLNNVLSWSKNQMDGIKFTVSTVNVYDLLYKHLLVFNPIAQSKHISLQINIEQGVYIKANGDMLQLVIRNLINNAIKFTSPGGNVSVITSAKDSKCLITVTDSGNGRPIKLSDEIFELNAEPAVGTGMEKGAGLGLVLCKQFTEAQNGRIWFKCDPQSGTSFFVEFPVVKKEEELVAI